LNFIALNGKSIDNIFNGQMINSNTTDTMNSPKRPLFLNLFGFTEAWTLNSDQFIIGTIKDTLLQRRDFYANLNGKIVREEDKFSMEHANKNFEVHCRGRGAPFVIHTVID
jgi:hypothetical protein